MPGVKKKDLHLSESVGGLNKMANTLPDIKSVRVCVNSAQKLFKKAEETNLLGDEETAYVLYMKYFNFISGIKKTAEYKKNESYFKDLIGMKNLLKAMDEAEKLSESLKNRYEEREAETVSKKLESLNKTREIMPEIEEKPPDPPQNRNGDVSDPDKQVAEVIPTTKTGFVTVSQLYTMLQDNNTSLIVMDVRAEEEYRASHIHHMSCINVPYKIVPPGCTVNKIEKELPDNSRDLWDRRALVDFIILVDWLGIEDNMLIGSTMQSLKDALYKWDQRTIIKSEPLVVEGGYNDILLYYPMLATNAHVPRPSFSNVSSQIVPSLDTIDYDLELNFLKSPEELASEETQKNLTIENLSEKFKENNSQPRIDRSIKPRGMNSNLQNTPLNTDRNKENKNQTTDFRKPDINFTLNDLRRELMKEEKPINHVKDTNVTKQGTVEIPKVVMPSVDRTQKPRGDTDTSPELSVIEDTSSSTSSRTSSTVSLESTVASPKHTDSDSRPPLTEDDVARIRQDNHRLVLEHKARIAKLKREQESMGRLQEIKSKEVKETASLLRAKQQIQQEILQMERLLEEKERRMAAVDERWLDEQIRRQHQMEDEDAERQKLKQKDDGKQSSEASLKTEEEKNTSEPDRERMQKEQAERNRRERESAERLTKEQQEREARLRDEQTKKDLALKADQARKDEQVRRVEQAKQEEQARRVEQAKQEEQARRVEQAKQEEHEQRVEQAKLEEQARRVEQARREEQKKNEEQARKEQERREEEARKQEQARREHQERLRKEQEERARSERAKKDKEEREKALEARNKQASKPKLVTPGLRVGWEKRLDTNTGRYYYIDHETKKTHWEPPQLDKSAEGQVSSDSPYKVRLKDEHDAPSGGGLKRSHSSPNIAKMMANEDQKTIPHPVVERTNKPKPRPESRTITLQTELSSAKVRNLQPVWGSMGRGLTGLKNLGNTCYMNSIIQNLSNTPPLTFYFLSDTYKLDINRQNIFGKGGEVAEEYAALVKALWSGQYKSVSPRDFKLTVAKFHELFAGYSQQDSQELLLFLMDGLHEDLNKVVRRKVLPEQNNDGIPDVQAAETAWRLHKTVNESIIVELFQGQFKSTVKCLTCSKRSVTFDAFMYLTLPIPSPTRCSLKESLLHFSKEEKMSGESQWHCPGCKCPRDAVKQIVIWKLPPILLIHLKRFYYQGMWRQKIAAYVDYPLDGLDMNKFVSGPKERKPYTLYGVSNHYGSLDGGHYTAYCKNATNQRWCKYDDHEVYDISSRDIQSSAAYILFYSSIDMRPLFK